MKLEQRVANGFNKWLQHQDNDDKEINHMQEEHARLLHRMRLQ
jgi:hypothetical protein